MANDTPNWKEPEQARKLVCHRTLVMSAAAGSCIADLCAAWRTDVSGEYGYCGLCGIPPEAPPKKSPPG